MTSATPARKRRWWRVLAALVVLAVAAVAALPWGLASRPGQRWLIRRANRALAPATIDFATVRVSWFGTTRLTGFVLRDADGEKVLEAPAVRWDRNLGQILFQRPRLGTIDCNRARMAVDRRADGTIDLYEAVKPLFIKHPKADLHLRIHCVAFRFRDAGQPVPVEAESAELALDIPPAPHPLTGRIALTNTEKPRPAALEIKVRDDRWATPAEGQTDLTIEATGIRWPWDLTIGGVESTGRFDGRLVAKRAVSSWDFAGDTALLDLDARGPRLAGDHLRLDRVTASWHVAKTGRSWAVERLDLDSPVGSLKAAGTLGTKPGSEGRIEGMLDLVPIAQQLPHVLGLREGITLDRGNARLSVQSWLEDGTQILDVAARISDLRARKGNRPLALRDPATLSARLTRRGDRLAIERFAARTAFLAATGQGDVDRGIAFSGKIDLGGFERQLRELVDFGRVELAGTGTISGHYRRAGGNYESDLAVDLRGLRVAGLPPATFERDTAHLAMSLAGPAEASGLPRDWARGRLSLASGDASAELSAAPAGKARTFTLAIHGPIGPRQGEGRFESRWDGKTLSIDRLRLALSGAGNEAVAIEARGSYDRDRGELVLTRPAAAGRARLALSDDGLRVEGIGRSGRLRISAGLGGDLDVLTAVAGAERQNSLAGTWTSRLTAEASDGGLWLSAKVDGRPRVQATRDGRTDEPVGLALSALYTRDADRLNIAELVCMSRYARLEGSGSLTDLRGRCVADLKGTLTPDSKAIDALLAERVEPAAHLESQPRAWRLRGELAAAKPLEALDGEFGLDLRAADIYGMHLGPAPLVVRTRAGRLVLDTIDTTLNGGRIHLEPELAVENNAGLALRLGPASTIRDAEINDEVSRRFLSYVAPVLDRATRAHGRVSVTLKDAVIPLGVGGGDAAASRKAATVDGQVVFQEVEFLPGPFADELFDLVRLDERPALKLDQPVALTIADRRVYQRGMAIPLGRLTRIELEGWVDFDRNIRLVASVPITPAMVGNAPVLSDIVSGQRISVPITGTLREPKIDRDALNLALKDLGKSLLENGAVRGAAELLMRLGRRVGEGAPPPLTRDQRKARRQERRTERRLGRPPEP